MPGKTNTPLELPTVAYTDVFRATPAILEEALNRYAAHSHQNLADGIRCLTGLVASAQTKTRDVLARQVGGIRSLSIRRDSGEDATTFTDEDDIVPPELCIPVAVENTRDGSNVMKFRAAVVISNGGTDADITVVKTKKNMTVDQNGGDS